MTIAQNEILIRSAYKEVGNGVVMLAQRIKDQDRTISLLLNNTALATDWDRLKQQNVGLLGLNGELRTALNDALNRIPAVRDLEPGELVPFKPSAMMVRVAVDVQNMPQVLAEFGRLRETVNGQRATIRTLQNDVSLHSKAVANVREANAALQNIVAGRDKDISRLRQLLNEAIAASTFKARAIKPTTRLGKRIAGRKAKAKT